MYRNNQFGHFMGEGGQYVFTQTVTTVVIIYYIEILLCFGIAH